YSLFAPVFAQRLKNGNTLISDIGNKKIIEVTPDKKTVWQYPAKKSGRKGDINFQGANFCQKLPNNNILYTFDKVYEIDSEGNTQWFYSRNASDIDINWAYKLENNQVLVNITRIVRRGINQEIMLVDNN